MILMLIEHMNFLSQGKYSNTNTNKFFFKDKEQQNEKKIKGISS